MPLAQRTLHRAKQPHGGAGDAGAHLIRVRVRVRLRVRVRVRVRVWVTVSRSFHVFVKEKALPSFVVALVKCCERPFLPSKL